LDDDDDDDDENDVNIFINPKTTSTNV